jgi:hypothetical protein
MFVSDLRSSVVFPNTPVSLTNKTDRHDIIKALLKVALNTITLIPNPNTLAGFELTTLEVIGTDCLGSCKSNHHPIMITLNLTWTNSVEIQISFSYSPNIDDLELLLTVNAFSFLCAFYGYIT